MSINYYHIDTFTDNIFSGNPAGVCILSNKWLPVDIMQKIAFENNLSETAFVLQEENLFSIRWFTPVVEVDLCGHATLAAAHIFFNHLGYEKSKISFDSRSGPLHVYKQNNLCVLDFPADIITPVKINIELQACFNVLPSEVYKGKTDLLFIYSSEEDIVNIQISLENISRLNCRGVIISAPGEKSDFVSRFFAPQSGIDEDPVTGSAHTTLVPYWSKQLNKNELTALQLSKRGGSLFCTNKGDRILIGGSSVTYKTGNILI